MKYIATIGVFDGVHLGHQKLIRKTSLIGKKKNLTSLVITFSNHPASILTNRHIELLTHAKEKEGLIKHYGAQKVLMLTFTKSLSSTEPKLFVEKLIRLGVRAVVSTKQFKFGNNRKGSLITFRKYNLFTFAIPRVRLGDSVVSSSIIRRFIAQGKIKKANQFLGRRYSITEKVVGGNHRSLLTGYPTANVTTTKIMPHRGVYSVLVTHGGKIYKGMCNIGFRPTFKNGLSKKLSIEAHLIGYKGNLYGKNIKIKFCRRIRNEIKFDSVDLLKQQLKMDCKTVLRTL